jgi:hypothetical protein
MSYPLRMRRQGLCVNSPSRWPQLCYHSTVLLNAAAVPEREIEIKVLVGMALYDRSQIIVRRHWNIPLNSNPAFEMDSKAILYGHIVQFSHEPIRFGRTRPPHPSLSHAQSVGLIPVLTWGARQPARRHVRPGRMEKRCIRHRADCLERHAPIKMEFFRLLIPLIDERRSINAVNMWLWLEGGRANCRPLTGELCRKCPCLFSMARPPLRSPFSMIRLCGHFGYRAHIETQQSGNPSTGSIITAMPDWLLNKPTISRAEFCERLTESP